MVALPGTDWRPPTDRRLPGLGRILEDAFDAQHDVWRDEAHAMAGDPGAELAHTPAMVTDASDFGLLLAWSQIVDDLACQDDAIVAVCDDPWLFRHLAGRPGMTAASAPPGLIGQIAANWMRGLVARGVIVLRLLRARLTLPPAAGETGGTYLLVYGHPQSRRDGHDAYFGDVMARHRNVRRIVHVDCPLASVRALAGARTESLHAYGPLVALVEVFFARWRPSLARRSGPLGWLVRRQASLEGATGTAPMIAWQRACQAEWLRQMRPACVVWPWENHAWERDFVRRARAQGIRTIGYQHSTVSPREWYNGANAAPDGCATLPDRIVCSGPMGRRSLIDLGVPGDRIQDVGAFRYADFDTGTYDPQGPVFFALPADVSVARELVQAARRVAAAGRRVQVRCHPFARVALPSVPGLAEAPVGLFDGGGVAAVVFAGTTVGLEAVLAGLPTVRFLPGSRVAHNPPSSLPYVPPTADLDDIVDVLANTPKPPSIDPHSLFSPPNATAWAALLEAGAGS